MRTIPDKIVTKIPIKDNGEKLFDVRKICPKIIIAINITSKLAQKLQGNVCYLRETAAKKLCKAQKSLPKNYHLKLWDAYRPLKAQKEMYLAKYNKLKKKYPNWSKEKLKKETSKFVAPLDIVPPHSTGGTTDLTVVGPDGKELDMGTKYAEFGKKTYTYCKTISKIAKKNRKLLISVMKKAGFVNYPPEWWHWSYGDQYWAATLKKKYSIYKGI